MAAVAPSKPYIVRRGNHVFHRATGLYLGQVLRGPLGVDASMSGTWHAYVPWSDEAVGDISATRHDAAMELLLPDNAKVQVLRRVCRECRNRMPHPRECRSGECETYEQASARSRVENKAEWAHYDALCRISNWSQQTTQGGGT